MLSLYQTIPSSSFSSSFCSAVQKIEISSMLAYYTDIRTPI
jgi:hypothetical protein